MRLVDFALIGLAAAATLNGARAETRRTQAAPVMMPAPNVPALAKAPLRVEGESRISIAATMRLLPDGTLEGEATTTATGMAALRLNRFMKALEKLPIDEVSASLLARQSLPITIRGLRHSASGESDALQASATVNFVLDANTGRSGQLVLPLEPGPRLVRGGHIALVMHSRQRREEEIACPKQDFEQLIEIHLLSGQRLVDLPSDSAISLGGASFKASYRQEGTILRIHRRLSIDTRTAICSAERVKDIAPAIHAAARDFNRQITIGNPGD